MAFSGAPERLATIAPKRKNPPNRSEGFSVLGLPCPGCDAKGEPLFLEQRLGEVVQAAAHFGGVPRGSDRRVARAAGGTSSGPGDPPRRHDGARPQTGVVQSSIPGIVLEITTTQEGRTELVAAGFDAGIHLGESIQRDMVAVRVSREQRLAVVGSPEYFASHPKPRSPNDLPNDPCINLRAGAPQPYGWEFEKAMTPSSST